MSVVAVNDEFAEANHLYDESDYAAPRGDGSEGPPENWELPSWFNSRDGTWWFREKRTWRLDPCPVRALGAMGGDYSFITAFGEIRSFTSAQLHGRGGLADLFGGQYGWPLKHFREYDHKTKELKGGLQREKCIALLIRLCLLAGYYDGSKPHRSVGIWRGPDGTPVVHAGDRIFCLGEALEPGAIIGEALFVIGGAREAPAHEVSGKTYKWKPAPANIGRLVSEHLDRWVWDSAEARDLFQGGLHCDMLCSALSWLPHKFVLAPYGSGKTALLRYARSLVGGGAHAVQRTYSKAYLEQHFAGTGNAFYLDETESDEEGNRIRKIFELVRLLSDDGAEGGRGSAGGRSRKLDVHGTVTMAGTMTEEWTPQDRSRITLLELRPFSDRGPGHPPALPGEIAAILKQAAKYSPALRARAIEAWPLFNTNLRIARAAILEMGGQPRDADQLGHLIAGWKTMTSDDMLSDVDQLERFRPFIMSLIESENGEDKPSDLLNTLFSTTPDMYRSGERLTIGQIIAKARSELPEAEQWRRALVPNGLRLEKQDGESWSQAWLWVATKHVGLDRLFVNHAAYRGSKRGQILKLLRRADGGVTITATRSQKHARFAGAQSHYIMVPPAFLPEEGDG